MTLEQGPETTKIYSLEVTEQEAVGVLAGRVKVPWPKIWKVATIMGLIIIAAGAVLFGLSQGSQGQVGGVLMALLGIVVVMVVLHKQGGKARQVATEKLSRMKLTGRWPQPVIAERWAAAEKDEKAGVAKATAKR
jgi:uncharacterized membrane protein